MPDRNAYFRTLAEGLEAKPAFFGDLDACEQQGVAAGEQMFLRHQNPYPFQSAEAEFWDGGWCNAIDELCGDA